MEHVNNGIDQKTRRRQYISKSQNVLTLVSIWLRSACACGHQISNPVSVHTTLKKPVSHLLLRHPCNVNVPQDTVSIWSWSFHSETRPPWEGGGQTHPQQRPAAGGDLEQSIHMARHRQLPPEVLPALQAAHQRPVATRKSGSVLFCSVLLISVI